METFGERKKESENLSSLLCSPDVRMGRVPSTDLVSASHGPVYQRRFEAIKEIWGGVTWTDTWKYLWVYMWNRAPTMPLSACEGYIHQGVFSGSMSLRVTAIALLYCSFSLTVLAFYTIATPVAVHIFGDLASRAAVASDRSYSTHHFSMSTQGGVDSTSEVGKGKKGVRPREGVGQTNEEKSIKLLTAWEFRDRFRIPFGITIRSMESGPVSIKEESFNAIIFTKEQFNAKLHFPLPSLFKQFIHFTKIPSAFLHSNVVRILMGFSLLNMLYHLNLSLLEIPPRARKRDMLSFRALGLVHMSIRLMFLNHVAHWGFREREGEVDWWNGWTKPLLTESYVIPTLPCFVPRVLVPEEHFVLKNLPFYKEAREALGTGCPIISFTAHPLIKKKSIFEPTEKALNLSPSPSFSVEVGTGSPSNGDSSDQEPEPEVPFINLDPEREEKEEIALRLAANFKERHHKHLSEALPAAALPTMTKSSPEAPHEEPASHKELAPGTSGVNANEGDASDNPSSWEDIAALLKKRGSPFPWYSRVCALVYSSDAEGITTINNLMQQQSSLLKLLEVTESMQVFLTQHIDNSAELHAQLVRVENELTTVRKVVVDAEKLLKELEEGMQAAKAETCQMGEEKEVAEAKCKDIEQESDQLKKELEELRVASKAQKKWLEELRV
ncbi:hypothetical protein CK203_100882 [Vitis vinifera]|uniref:Uncharacterized protein n=1 Tax=Vitis vinifera TaxID=29760 RepID=A0A438CZH4_VITVI|nr:hypothetical protein CK203_100882 [Vitis vinifera]